MNMSEIIGKIMQRNKESKKKEKNKEEEKTKTLAEEHDEAEIESFIKENVIERPGEFITRKEFKQKINEWLQERNLKTLNKKEITKVMKEKYETAYRERKEENINCQRVWNNITWKTYKQEMENKIKQIQQK